MTSSFQSFVSGLSKTRRFLAAALLTSCVFTSTTSLRAAPDDSLSIGGWDLESTSRTLPIAINSAVNIGTFNFVGAAAGSLKVTVNVNATNYSVSKQYMIPMRWSALPANTWHRTLPTVNTGAYGNNDFDLDIMSASGPQLALRLRTSISDGAHAGVADIVIESTGVSSIVFSSSTAAVAVPAPLFLGNAITQYRGNVGIGSVPANDAVLDLAGGDTKGLRLRPRSLSGPPTTGTWSVGTMIMDSNVTLYVCTTAGTPGIWKKVGL